MRLAWLVCLAGCGRVAFDARPDASAGSDAAPDALACSAPFTQYPTGCYLPLATSLTWDDAREACAAMGSDLAIITSDTENDQLIAIAAAERSWIGLTDRVVELSFVWVDGTPLGYDAWSAGEPNSDLRDCVELAVTPRVWNEESCAQLRASICER